MTIAETPDLEAGKAWLRMRLERRVHPLDHLDLEAAARTIDSLTSLDPESWTDAWGALADEFVARAEAVLGTAEERAL